MGLAWHWCAYNKYSGNIPPAFPFSFLQDSYIEKWHGTYIWNIRSLNRDPDRTTTSGTGDSDERKGVHAERRHG